MSYIDDNLMDGEKVEYRAELSNWAFFSSIAISVILIPVIVGIIGLFIIHIVKKSTEIAVTNKRLIYKKGFIQRDTVELNIKKIESMQVEQTIVGRIFNYGTLIVSGTGSSHAPIKYIRDPMKLRTEISSVIDKAI